MKKVRKRKKKTYFNGNFAVGLLTACMVVLLTGCGSASKYDMAYDMAMPQGNAGGNINNDSYSFAAAEAGEMLEGVSKSESVSDSAAQTNRKLIQTVNMDVETREFDSLTASIQNQVRILGGYIESMNTYNGSSYYGYSSRRNAEMTIRIPAENLDDFLNTISGISNVVRRSDNVEDITLNYVDLQSHKEALQTEHTRLLELLERAETIEDIITIESRLSDIRYQMESMESQLRTYDNKVDYSTVYLNIDEVEVLTPVQEETVWERISGGFLDSLKNIGDGLVELVVRLLINLPYLILLAIVVTVLVIVIRLLIQQGDKKRAKQAEERAKQQAQMQARQMQMFQQAQQAQQNAQQVQQNAQQPSQPPQ